MADGMLKEMMPNAPQEVSLRRKTLSNTAEASAAVTQQIWLFTEETEDCSVKSLMKTTRIRLEKADNRKRYGDFTEY